MTSEITEAMVERAHEAYSTFGQVGHLRDQRPSDAHMKAILTAALAARPAPEAGSVVERVGYMIENPSAWDTFDQKASDLLAECTAALAEANEKTERLERERDGALKAHDIIVGSALKWRDRLLVSEARASELQRDVERLREAIKDALGRHQVTHIHAGLRAAIKQEGESDE